MKSKLPGLRDGVAHLVVVLVSIALFVWEAKPVAAQPPVEKAKAAVEKATAERQAAERLAAEKAAATKEAAERVAAAEAAAKKAAAEQSEAERTAEQAADTALAQKVAAEKVAKDTLLAERAFHQRMAAEKALSEKAKAEAELARQVAAAQQAAAQLAAVERAAVASSDQELADKLKAGKAAVVKANAEKAGAEQVLAEKLAALPIALDQAATAHASALGGLKPIAACQWDYAKARHLLVRAGFGGTPDEVRALCEMGLHEAVNYMVDIYDRPQAHIEFDVMRLERPEPWEARLEPKEREELSNRRTNRERRQQAELRRWWLQRMAESPRPLQEKLTLFWHDHFAVQYLELYRTYMLYQQNELFRTYGCDNYAALLHGIIQDPAMIRYLDNHQNSKGRGNENLGRELQELFSLGEEFSANHVPDGYTEQDVREASRALTGYTYDSWAEQFRFYGTRYDETTKTVLNRKGNWSGNEVVDIILRHPSTAKYICKKLFIFFAYDNPEPLVIDQLAHVLRACSYDMRPMLKNLFLSEVFYSDKAMGKHIKGPVELVVGTIRDFGIKNANYGAVDSAVIQMGQTLFEPPNVAGWDENRSWINAERILVRYNQMARLVEGQNIDFVALLEGRGLHTPQAVVDYLTKTCWVVFPSEAKRRELQNLLGELPPAEQWTAQRSRLNSKLRTLVVLLMSMPESQLG